MGFLKKSKKANKVIPGLDAQNMMIAKGMYEAQVQAHMCTASTLLAIGKNKMEKDIRGEYQRQVERIKADVVQQANEQIAQKEREAVEMAEAYERKCRADYDEHMRLKKTALKKEVIGDLLMMMTWVMRDYFHFEYKDVHEFLLQMLRLEATMNDSQQEDSKLERITVNDIVNQMKREGFDMCEDILLVEEMVSAEMERFNRPYTPSGSVLNTWSKDEDKRLKRLVLEQERDYPEIALIMQRTESACKSRVRKVFGTSVLERVRGEVA